MRPFELEKFGLNYDSLSQLNPKLIYASLTGLGKKGSERNEPGYDQTGYWARSGVAYMITPPEIAPDCRVGAFGDNMAGMFLAFGIMTALFARDRTGIGQEVDLSLFQTGVTQLSWDIAEALVTRQDRPRVGRKDQPNALMNAYQTRDRRWLLLVILEPDRYWSALCRAIGREDLEHDRRFDSFQPRLENHAALFSILEEVFLTRTLDEWKVCLAGIPFAPVQSLSEVIADPQARANDFFLPFDHPTFGRIEVVANPIHLSKTPPTVRTPAPEFSQHTEEVLLEYGCAWKDIERFKQQHII
jgi:crotonobetainyl-CoA:carnitine CoA-transferase CaiB-like acyl-CoA transferase